MEPVNARFWSARAAGPESVEVETFCRELVVLPLTARLLLRRGFELEAARAFLAARLAQLPDPFDLPDMEAAVLRLQTAIAKDEPIAVHGDYDVDGISGTVLLVEGLRALGARQVEFHIPLRLKDGYGLSAEAIVRAAAAGVKVIVSVDCGVSAHAEAALAVECGLDLIITDHHQAPRVLPPACAVINPQRADSRFPFTGLCGVGVAFFLLIALRQRLRDQGAFLERAEPDLRNLLDLVALGTIADLVPLQGVNRILTRSGLALLESGRRIGVSALKQVAAVKEVTCGTVGYQLAPRLNAAGRMEDAGLGVELLLSQDMASALTIARHLDQCNRERRELEQQTLQQAEAAVAKLPATFTHSIVLGAEGWHPGVIGIVASRLVERYHRPTVLIALDGDAGKGSARSISGFHLYRGLEECAAQLLAFGGHEMAAGLSLAAASLPDFSAAFEAHARQVLPDEALLPIIRHDGSLLLEELDLESVRQLATLAPFGMGNPEPQMVVEAVRARQIQTVGERHLRFTVCQGGYSFAAIAFGMVGRRSEFEGEIDLLVTPQINSYRERDMVQLRVRDVKRSGA